MGCLATLLCFNRRIGRNEGTAMFLFPFLINKTSGINWRILTQDAVLYITSL